ncbi:DeSI-like protein [Lachnellula willkommii]|uniref:DeSI-like protein n=1 Tax=Lachnellula willkommii TaxID=215461 RepID=A0A559M989_9HELO|nr:DeSI-like protein [Lachnellula willkommii]
MSSKKSSRKASSQSHRSTLSFQKTEIIINVYDLLPPGRLASMLWTVGASLLHSGIVINKREYAYGGHDKRGMTGVYWTKPKSEPPGGTFKCEILHGFTVAPQDEIDAIVKEASDAFQGTSYNLLTRNCNHFTAYLCEKLTGRPGPSWLNRAASIGVALPCVVPREWIAPPDFDTADGELLDDDEHNDSHEGSRMLGSTDTSHQRWSVDNGSRSFDEEWDSEQERLRSAGAKGKGKAPARDTSGRIVPPSERAPTARGP